MSNGLYKCSECGEILKQKDPEKSVGLICDNCGAEYGEIDIEALEKVEMDEVFEGLKNENFPDVGAEMTKKALEEDEKKIKKNEEKENEEEKQKKVDKEKEKEIGRKEGRNEKGQFIKGNKLSVGNKGGRPTYYTEEYCLLVDKYLKKTKDSIFDFHKTKGKHTNSFQRCIRVDLPTIEGFAKFIDVPLTTVNEWANAHSEFLLSLEEIKSEQKQRLINCGLSGEYNPLIAKLVLSANHGMKEKTEQDVNLKNPVVVKVQKQEDYELQSR